MVCPFVVRVRAHPIEKTFLACMFCFPITDRVMVPQRTVSCIRIHDNERQKANSLENITWSELGKQNMQAKEVYSKNIWVKHKSIKT